MSKLPHDINDDEIRIISSKTANGRQTTPNPPRHISFRGIVLIICGLLALGLTLFFASRAQWEADKPSRAIESDPTIKLSKPYVAINDTTINGIEFKIYIPTSATPRLHVGGDILNDSTVVMAVQAADIRDDNGRIVGAYVLEGELLSKGHAKSGYCAIIGDKINLGVAKTTPLLEEALETNGYFFRQYPLVVANQIVENKPKGKSLRKALAELDGRIVVITSSERLTFHDFSQALVDIGVSNAIYLVGASTYGFAINKDGRKIEFGKRIYNLPPNTNYIVWE